MKTMTLRGIDAFTAEELARVARSKGKSLNQFVLEAIRAQLGLDGGKKRLREYHDLDHLFGGWTEEEFKEIQGKIDAERRIDTELWA